MSSQMSMGPVMAGDGGMDGKRECGVGMGTHGANAYRNSHRVRGRVGLANGFGAKVNRNSRRGRSFDMVSQCIENGLMIFLLGLGGIVSD